MPRLAKKSRARKLATPEPTAALHDYHLVTVSSERNISATGLSLTNLGTLVFLGPSGEATVVYAPGQWLMVEVERKDDKSSPLTVEDPA